MQKVTTTDTRKQKDQFYSHQGREKVKLKEQLNACSADLVEEDRCQSINSLTSSQLFIITGCLLLPCPTFFLIIKVICAHGRNLGKLRKL